MKKIIEYIKNSCLIRSFKVLDKRLFVVMISELLLVISISIIFLFSGIFLKTSLTSLGISDELMEKINANLNNQTFAMELIQGQMKYTSPERFQSFLTKLLSNIFLSIITITFIISLFKSYEWCKIIRKKFNMSFFIKYFGLFLIWNASWLILFLLISLGFQTSLMKYFIWVWLFFFVYFSFLIYPIFAQEKKIFLSIKKTLRLGFTKPYKLVFPLVNIWLLLQLGYLFIILFSKIPVIAGLFSILYLLVYIAWIKFYMWLVIKDVMQ